MPCPHSLVLIICLGLFFMVISTLTELPAYNYLRSIHNISSERSWLRLRLDFGDNAVLFFNKGIEGGVYNPDDANH
jgi:hypothetical protein